MLAPITPWRYLYISACPWISSWSLSQDDQIKAVNVSSLDSRAQRNLTKQRCEDCGLSQVLFGIALLMGPSRVIWTEIMEDNLSEHIELMVALALFRFYICDMVTWTIQLNLNILFIVIEISLPPHCFENKEWQLLYYIVCDPDVFTG